MRLCADGGTLGAIWLGLGSVAIAEIAGHAGADLLVLDLQHGLWERRDVEAAIGLSAVPVLACVSENGAFSIGPALDAGVLVSMVETAEQARGGSRGAISAAWHAFRRGCPSIGYGIRRLCRQGG